MNTPHLHPITRAQPRTSTPQLHPHVAAKVQALAPDFETRILDLGCGSGSLLERLAGLGYRQLTGVDIRPPATTAAIRYEQADLDLFRLDAAEGSFDLALAVEVIEHIENSGLFLAELARLLKPGGLALFTTPNLHSAEAKLLFSLADRLKQFDAKGDPTHITPIVLFPFTRLLNRHGFTVLESWGFPLDGSSPSSRPAMRVAARLVRPLLSSRVQGDNLIMIVQRKSFDDFNREVRFKTKAYELTSHYE
jgi:2-polyprenyl-3-methyl-5-hydroxy-6-metoxy-1,4-benzoquinol methylase